MSIEITVHGETVFSLSGDDHILMPFKEEERDQVQSALIAALATLSGFMPQSSIASTEADSDERCPEIELCQGVQEDGVVVRLSERRGSGNKPTTQ